MYMNKNRFYAGESFEPEASIYLDGLGGRMGMSRNWVDEHGRPREERHAVSNYAESIEQAGISRDMIRLAIDEAAPAHLIRCVQFPLAKAARQSSVTGLYELEWGERREYVKDPKRFRGFVVGEGPTFRSGGRESSASEAPSRRRRNLPQNGRQWGKENEPGS